MEGIHLKTKSVGVILRFAQKLGTMLIWLLGVTMESFGSAGRMSLFIFATYIYRGIQRCFNTEQLSTAFGTKMLVRVTILTTLVTIHNTL
jgi:preprotein translocase subunit SecY